MTFGYLLVAILTAAIVVFAFQNGTPLSVRFLAWTVPEVSAAAVILIALVSGLASLAGYSLFRDASPDTVAFVLCFAGGAILTMLADTMMPEAFEHGGRLVGVVTTFGFALAFAISSLQ